MNRDLMGAATRLNKGQLQRIEDGRGSRVLCISGCLWLTQQGSLRDIVLKAGEEVTLSYNGASILVALDDSRFVQATPPAAAPQTRAFGGALHALAALKAGARRALWLA